MSTNIVEWEKKREDYKKLWNQLSSSIKGSAIDPIVLDCSLLSNKLLEKAISAMEGMPRKLQSQRLK